MSEVSVPWDNDKLQIDLPKHWHLAQTAAPRLRTAPEDWRDRLATVLSQPDTGPPLYRLLAQCKNGRVVIVVEDLTRTSPLPEILEVVMREIRHAQVPDDQVEIVFATGMHPPLTPAEAEEKLGHAARGIARRSNPWHEDDRYVSAGQAGKVNIRVDEGVASADLRILISSVSPHLQAGFGGGYKMLLPGCAALDTIRGLHRQGVGRRLRQLVGLSAEDNPMRSAIDAGGAMIDETQGRSFALQYLLDENDLPSCVAAGEVIPTQRMLAKQCAVDCGVLVQPRADVLVVNAYPRDFDLWQSFKCIANTLWALRPGGVMIVTTPCRAGLHGMEVPNWPVSPVWTRRAVRLLGADALGSLLMRLAPKLAGDAAFFIRLALRTLHRNPIIMVSPKLAHQHVRFPGIELFEDIDKAVDRADEILDRRPQQVVVFPAGGVTYPVPVPPAARTIGP
ncbi:MAG: lactate racemase domain-containing protein [Phycisphaerae bacterium]